MKKTISLVMVIAMLLSCVAFAVPASAKAKADNIDYVDALYFENAPTVDGYISDAEWGEYSVFVEALDCATIDDTSPYSRFFYNRVSATNMDDYGSFAYYVWLRWSENYFYIGVKVKDANVHSLKNGTTNTWNGDAIQTRIDKAGANAAVNGGNFTVTADRQKPWSTNLVPDFLFGYSEIAGGFSEAWENNSNKGMTSFSRNPLGTAPCVVAPAGSSYSTDTQNGITTYEVAIPWTYILNGDFDSLTYTEYKTGRNGNLQGGIGREFGMSLAVLDDGNDATAGWDAYMSWGSGICETHQTEGALAATGSNAVTLSATPVAQQAGYQTYDPTPLLDAKFSQNNIDAPGVFYDYLAGDSDKTNKLTSRDQLSALTYDDPADLSVWGGSFGGIIKDAGGKNGNVLDYRDLADFGGEANQTYIDTRDGEIGYKYPTSYTFEFDINYAAVNQEQEGYEPAIYNWFGGASVWAYQCGYFFNDNMFKVVNSNDAADVLASYPYSLKKDNWYNWKFQFDNESCNARLWIDDLSTEADNVESGTPGEPGYTNEWGTLVINTSWRYFYYSSDYNAENGTLLLFRQMNTAVAYDNVKIYNFASATKVPVKNEGSTGGANNGPVIDKGDATIGETTKDEKGLWNVGVIMDKAYVGANSLTIKLPYNAETTTFDSIAGLAEGTYTVDTSTAGMLIIKITDANVLKNTAVGAELFKILFKNDTAESAADLGLGVPQYEAPKSGDAMMFIIVAAAVAMLGLAIVIGKRRISVR